jgi:hypothetical protein
MEDTGTFKGRKNNYVGKGQARYVLRRAAAKPNLQGI